MIDVPIHMTHMRFGASCTPPIAWLALIARKPHLAMRSYEPGQAPAGKETTATLYRVQEAVNASIRYVADAVGSDTWGVLIWRKIWGLTGRRWIRVGDCDDYAVAKLERLLVDFGGSLRLVTCHTGREKHLVLAVQTTETTFILDNCLAGIWSWDDVRFSDYRWIAASVPGRLRWALFEQPMTLEDLVRKMT